MVTHSTPTNHLHTPSPRRAPVTVVAVAVVVLVVVLASWQHVRHYTVPLWSLLRCRDFAGGGGWHGAVRCTNCSPPLPIHSRVAELLVVRQFVAAWTTGHGADQVRAVRLRHFDFSRLDVVCAHATQLRRLRCGRYAVHGHTPQQCRRLRPGAAVRQAWYRGHTYQLQIVPGRIGHGVPVLGPILGQWCFGSRPNTRQWCYHGPFM